MILVELVRAAQAAQVAAVLAAHTQQPTAQAEQQTPAAAAAVLVTAHIKQLAQAAPVS